MLRYIITGTPGAGKTAMLRLLEAHGHTVVEEAATDIMALELALGNERPWTDPGFTNSILRLQRRREERSTPADEETVFFDRSPVCTLALSRWLGHAPSPLLVAEIDRVVRGRTYEQVIFFVRNQGAVAPTAARRISFAESLKFERLHEETYRELGFALVDVPAGPLATRVGLVEASVSRLAGAVTH